MRIQYGIIILNYIAWEETIDCVNSFLRQKNDHNIYIVVVDNGSPNESVLKLREAFINEPMVDVLCLNENSGFARGNNAGFRYLREKIDCDFFVFSNSDIIIDGDVFSWIENEFELSHFNLLGPDIFAIKMQKHQNPLRSYTENRLVIELKILKKRIEILLNYILLKTGVKYNKRKIKQEQNRNVERAKRIENVTLHGSFIIAHKSFFDYYDELFDDRTFLYMEEHILFQRCKRKALKTLVSFGFQVTHLQAASTNKITKSIYARRIARMRNEIDSVKIYKKVLSELNRITEE